MLLWKLALRSLFLHKTKTLVTGLIIVLGTTLAIVGNSFVDAVSGGMKKSLTESLTGDIQVYSSAAKEKIAVLGGMDGSLPDIGHHPSFKNVKQTLLSEVPNIEAIVPLGVNQALINPGNLLDVKIEELRQSFGSPTRDETKIEALKGHLRAIVLDIEKSQMNTNAMDSGIFAGERMFKEGPQDIKRALSEDFWKDFNQNFEERIEFLANKMAPMILDDSMLYFNYIGTVPDLFQQSFSQFEIAKGSQIPEGARGFLFSDLYYETQVKHRVARRLDQIKKTVINDGKKIALDKDLQEKIKANKAQAAEIYSQIDPQQTQKLIPKLKSYLQSEKTALPELLDDFLTMDDTNLLERIDYFYENIAPHVVLYKVKVGDTFTVTSFSKTGYASSVNLKVYGTYKFKSFESSPLASGFNMMDMVSFRKLLGFVTEERRKESEEINKEMGISTLGREDMEALFAAKDTTTENYTQKPKLLEKLVRDNIGTIDLAKRNTDQVYSRDEMEDGVFLNAAILLKNPRLLKNTLSQIQQVSKDRNLGIQAADWQEASGILGQMTIMIRSVLYIFVFVIFAVATFIIMNSMLMATLERAREIGTMRAIGAQKLFLIRLFLRETFVLSFIFGTIGIILGLAIIFAINIDGIPAKGDVSAFFFSGDRLFLVFNVVHVGIVFVSMTLVALISTQYPAWRAMRISPLEAMGQAE
jgi:ABC-type lipoprotein release transport system permease subunit